MRNAVREFFSAGGLMLAFLVIVVLVLLVVKKDSVGVTECDGLLVYTDHLTDCQYVSTGGGITQRMDKNGGQICGKGE